MNDKDGAEAEDWQKGKPVRVLRKGGDEKSAAKGGKGKTKHENLYAPEIGVRYVFSGSFIACYTQTV